MAEAGVAWRVELFDGLRVVGSQTRLDRFQTRATASLIAYLALYPGRRHLRDVLSGIIWPDASPDAGRNRLSQAVGWIRPLLEPENTERGSILVADRQSVSLNPEYVTSDVAEFEAAARIAETSPDPLIRRAESERALRLYTGHLLRGYDDEWIIAERQRFFDRYLRLLARLLEDYQAAGLHDDALTVARRALILDPLSEELNGHVIRTLIQRGETAVAWRHYHEFEELLLRTLEQTPSEELTALLAIENRPRTTTAAPRPVITSSLPQPMTRFFGREKEQEQLQQWFQAPRERLMTLTGLGGTGKTRLAIEASRAYSEASGTPAWFIPLADLHDADPIPNLIADILRLPAPGNTSVWEHLRIALSGKPGILILDNLEHLTEKATPLLRKLLEGVPELKILATSRQRLGLEGEQELTLPPLSAPKEINPSADLDALSEFAAVRLFLDRAQAIRSDFALTPQNASTISKLCTQLEGWPLAIELCAAWAQTLTPEQMLTQLKTRFDLLVSRRRDIPERHRTLRTTLEYSFLLLPPSLQELLLQLSIFRGGWTLETANQICSEESTTNNELAMLNALTELRERSLIVAVPPPVDTDAPPEMRFRMLETVRTFAAEQRTLAMDALLLPRHFAYFANLATVVNANMTGPTPGTWLTRLDAELDNIRAALQWAQEGEHSLSGADVFAGLQLATTLTPFWEVRGYLSEGQDWLERFCAVCAGTTSQDKMLILAQGQLALGRIRRLRGNFRQAEEVLRMALPLFRRIGARKGIAQTLLVLGTTSFSQDDYPGAKAQLDEALSIARTTLDLSLIASVVINQGNIAMDEGDWELAWSYFQESLSLFDQLGNRKRRADILNNLGLVARYRGEYATAQSLLEESLVICREVSDRPGIAITLLNMATVCRLQGKTSEARLSIIDATALAVEVDNKRALAWCIKEAGHTALASHDISLGTRLLSASERLRSDIGISFKPADPIELERGLAFIHSEIGEQSFTRLWESGQRLTAHAAAELISHL